MLPASIAMPSAGSTVPSTSRDGIWTTKISSEVSVRTLTRMLNPRPKKAFVSPFVHQGSFRGGVSEGLSSGRADRGLSRLMRGSWRRAGQPARAGTERAESRADESATQPKIPPWAAIMSSPTRWNSGKYEPTQSESTSAL